MRNLNGTPPNRPGGFLPAPDSVIAVVLAANTAENVTKPTGAKFVEIVATVNSYLEYIDSAEATDLVTNGAFAADTGWTKGTGWAIAAGVATKTAGSASDLDQTPSGASAVVEGKAYRVTFTVSGYSAGNVTPKLGGTAGTARAANGTFTETIVAGASGKIALSADATFAGSIDNVAVAPIAHVPAADQTTGHASEIIPAGVPVQRYIDSVAQLSIVSAGTPNVTLAFWS